MAEPSTRRPAFTYILLGALGFALVGAFINDFWVRMAFLIVANLAWQLAPVVRHG